MTNSCSLSSARHLGVAAAAVGALAAPMVLVLGPGVGTPAALVAALVVAALAVVSWQRVRRVERALAQALGICDLAACGDFDHRIIGITEGGVVGALLHRTNDTLDLADGFLREAGAAMSSAAQKRYFRKVTVRGLKGFYRSVAETINQALENMTLADCRLDRVHHDLEALVVAAARGDLDRRIDVSDNRDAMARLGMAINQLVETTGTTIRVIDTVLSAIAAGDLEQRVTADLEGVFGAMGGNTNDMADRLAQIVGDLDSALSQIMMVTGEVAMGSRDLSVSTEEQAQLLSRTAATMVEISEKVIESTGAAEEGNRLVDDARVLAARGSQVADDAVAAMRRIALSSHKVSEVVVAIDEIAFQTNILALNASVEAARVGDAGRGFAVVASEVRQLAKRAAEANREIRAMMAESASHVASGVDLVLAAGQALGDIATAITVVGRNTEVIVGTSREQSVRLGEIADAVKRMEEMTRDNASLAQHSAGAAQTVEEQVLQLGKLLSYFQVGESAHAAE